MTYSYYLLLYTTIYDFCTQNKPHVTTFGAGARGGASLQGADLYRSLHGFLSEHCKNLREVGYSRLKPRACKGQGRFAGDVVADHSSKANS